MTDSSIQLANLMARYTEMIDGGDFEGVADLFSRASVGAGDSLLSGRDAVRDLYTATTRRYPDGTPGTKHVISNLHLDIDEEAGTAAARSYWTVLQAVEDLPLQPILAGRYHDRFQRQDGVWHFSERRFLIDLIGDVGHHMLGGLPG
jgi:hypothetical protein